MAELLKDAQIGALLPTPIMHLRLDEAVARYPYPDDPSNGVLVLHNPKGGRPRISISFNLMKDPYS